MILHAIDQGSGGETLVLLHGLFGSAGNFGLIQRRLATQRRVLALDLRNHGASPHADGMEYPAMAADVMETRSKLSGREASPVSTGARSRRVSAKRGRGARSSTATSSPKSVS